MSRFINKVTVTGADDTTPVGELLSIHAEFPFVEFGILLSRKQVGSPRFPSANWLREAASALSYRGIFLSGHICGSWVRDILMGAWPDSEFRAIHPDLMMAGMFKRFQLNTHAEPHDYDVAKLQAVVDVRKASGQSIIIQNDDVNTGLLALKGVETLFDLSHGAGVLPDKWPTIIDGMECGYAGGLSPDNVAGEIAKIVPVIGNRKIWIDAETHLRTFKDRDLFDLSKVRSFLRAAEPFVVESKSYYCV